VSDDTIYRALKDLGFTHVSAYKQDPEAVEAFKNTLPHAWLWRFPFKPPALLGVIG
jgi:hypothetical protein